MYECVYALIKYLICFFFLILGKFSCFPGDPFIMPFGWVSHSTIETKSIFQNENIRKITGKNIHEYSVYIALIIPEHI